MTSISTTASTHDGDKILESGVNEAYVNIVYPFSRRMYSRPFHSWHHTSNDGSTLNSFQDALHELGKDMLGDQFHKNLDIEAARKQKNFAPSYWAEDRIYRFSKTAAFKSMLGGLPANVAKAYEFVANECFACGGFEGASKEKRGYDMQGLTEAFKAIWSHDWMLDSRIMLAEEIFTARLALRSTTYSRVSGGDLQDLKTSLEWMMMPENASRVAQAFLYSRLSQHFGETDLRSREMAENIHAALKKGDMSALGKGVFEASNITGAFALVAGMKMAGLFSKMMRPKNPQALWASLPNIMIDHTRLLDGSWARQQLELRVKPLLDKGGDRPVLVAHG